jgi:hypothetical protein
MGASPRVARIAKCSVGMAFAVALVGLSHANAGGAAETIAPDGAKLVLRPDGALVVEDPAHPNATGAALTWGSAGVLWASPDARLLDPVSGQAITASSSRGSGAVASQAASFTCTLTVHDPVNYVSAGLVGGQVEQLCIGIFGTQFASSRLQVQTVLNIWLNSPWSNATQTAGGYSTASHFLACLQGTFRYRTNGQGHANGQASAVVLSGVEPRYTC